MKLVDKNTHDKVEEMLKSIPETQDSDTYLTALIWFKESPYYSKMQPRIS